MSGTSSRARKVWIPLILLTAYRLPLTAQSSDLTRERAEYAGWLAAAPFSPYAAIALQQIGPGISLGPTDADIPLSGITPARITEAGGGVTLEQGGQRRALPRNSTITLGGYRIMAAGPVGRTQVVVYGTPRTAKPPEFYPPATNLAFISTLDPPERRRRFWTLGSDGMETEATEAGFVTLPLATGPVRLRVYRMGPPDDDEAELQVFFRDSTNDHGSYPAGRFVTLDPAGPGKYRVDLNRAQNPFCAYNTVFPCPPPWPGNSIPMAVKAGEKYLSK